MLTMSTTTQSPRWPTRLPSRQWASWLLLLLIKAIFEWQRWHSLLFVARSPNHICCFRTCRLDIRFALEEERLETRAGGIVADLQLRGACHLSAVVPGLMDQACDRLRRFRMHGLECSSFLASCSIWAVASRGRVVLADAKSKPTTATAAVALASPFSHFSYSRRCSESAGGRHTARAWPAPHK